MSAFELSRLADVFGDAIAHDTQRAVTTLTHAFGREDFLRGHFPGFPVVPGVILLDGMIFAGLHAVKQAASADVGSIAVDTVTFHRPVLPGQEVSFSARIAGHGEDGLAARCAVMVDGARHARASMTFRLANIQS
ncbi:MAG TPA: hypothetical protein VNS02_08310 [Rhizobiaceae bacterium]|nr:hypothetical protein [Rhizobiaceae bacterium]